MTSKTPLRLSISSMSLGYSQAGHSLEHRLTVAAQHGYEGIELYYDDLENLAASLPIGPLPLQPCAASGPNDEQLLRAARLVRDTCGRLGLAVVCLQPFRHFEGLLDRTAHAARLDELRLWCRLAGTLQTDLILVPSSFLPPDQVSASFDVIARDLREAADIAAAASPPVRLCYEALAWGTAVRKWQESYDIVERVGRANFGLCLDTFNMAAEAYADPAEASGIQADGAANMQASLHALVSVVDVSRIFLVQAADGARLQAPLQPGHPLYCPDMPSRMSWSRNHRLFCAEASLGAYLPVMHILKAIFGDLGYRGWLSHELFNCRLSDTDRDIPREMAQRGVDSWKKIVLAVEVEMPAVFPDATQAIAI